MELDNVDVLLGMTIGAIILGIGVSMFFMRAYTGYGAVVLAIGMMTIALMITARPRIIEKVKREIVLQPSRQTEPTSITPPTFIIPTSDPTAKSASENQTEQTAPTQEAKAQEAPASAPQEAKAEDKPAAELTPPTSQPEQPTPPEKKEEEAIPAPPPS